MDIIKQWDNAAIAYTDSQEKSSFVKINMRVVSDRFKDLSNLTVLDAGCGYGNFTEYIRSVGAKVTGCDGSKKMINIAKERYPQCSFDTVDMSNILPYEDNIFDIVFSNQVLMDIENIETTLSEMSRVLRNHGTFYLSIVHPAFYDGTWQVNKNEMKIAKSIDKYISRYSCDNEFWGKTTHFHRPISYYFNLAAYNNLFLTHMEEPKTYDGIHTTDEIPLFLFAEFQKCIL